MREYTTISIFIKSDRSIDDVQFSDDPLDPYAYIDGISVDFSRVVFGRAPSGRAIRLYSWLSHGQSLCIWWLPFGRPHLHVPAIHSTATHITSIPHAVNQLSVVGCRLSVAGRLRFAV